MKHMVQDLTREQLNELKESFFWQDETQDILPDDIITSEQIPDYIIFEHYDGVCFTDDDFFCTAEALLCTRCTDCGAMVGHYHHPGCDVERCPVCGEQLISCGCQD